MFKFGGASVSSARSIENLAGIISGDNEKMIIVVSAFGKITNALEELLKEWIAGSRVRLVLLERIRNFHFDILGGLFPENDHPVYAKINYLFSLIEQKLNTSPSDNYDYEYDQLVSLGEVISTTIISCYLESRNITNRWIDAREWLVTDDTFREANVNFGISGSRLREKILSADTGKLVTQGFIGGTIDGITTTLGREGSDYTAAVAANLTCADSLVVWKDVPGILTADPSLFPGAELIDELSYHEAIELSFYGAKVIHPKTIKPLQNKNIPLLVKSFINPGNAGTLIHSIDKPLILKPILIIKKDQMLVSLTPKDFSFVVEQCLSKIFALFFKYRMKVNLLQHSAISFTICLDNRAPFVESLLGELKDDFRVLYNEGLELVTIRHYTPQTIGKFTGGRSVLVEQRSRSTVMFVVR